jgi:hypothetical protein
MTRSIISILIVLLLLVILLGCEIILPLRGGMQSSVEKASSMKNSSCTDTNKEAAAGLRGGLVPSTTAAEDPNDSSRPLLLSLDASSLLSLEQGSQCPELMAASRFALSTKKPPSFNMTMLQLVGQWSNPEHQKTMEKAFQHNRKLCNDNFGMSAYSITEAPANFFGQNSTNTTSPAFWKMLAIRDTCNAGSDVVWFLDADILLTDSTYPIRALWNFHLHFNPAMDILLGIDTNGINTGVFLVNCNSRTALEFLEEWHIGAPIIAKYGPGLMEQTFIQYVLEHGSYWVSYIPRTKVFKKNPIAKWDNYSTKAREDPETWSTKALRTRLPLIMSQCAMSAYPVLDSRSASKGARIWQPGDVSLHMAGMKTKQKMFRIEEYLINVTSAPIRPTAIATTAQDLALAYLNKSRVLIH